MLMQPSYEKWKCLGMILKVRLAPAHAVISSADFLFAWKTGRKAYQPSSLLHREEVAVLRARPSSASTGSRGPLPQLQQQQQHAQTAPSSSHTRPRSAASPIRRSKLAAFSPLSSPWAGGAGSAGEATEKERTRFQNIKKIGFDHANMAQEASKQVPTLLLLHRRGPAIFRVHTQFFARMW